jgi:hypothetical protein
LSGEWKVESLLPLFIKLPQLLITEYWLKTLFQGKYINEKGFQSMFKDNEEIIKILVKSIKTAKKGSNE